MTNDPKRLKIAAQLAWSVLDRLVANYESQRDQISDSDLDNEQPIAITFRGTLGDIRTARNASAMLKDVAFGPTTITAKQPMAREIGG